MQKVVLAYIGSLPHWYWLGPLFPRWQQRLWTSCGTVSWSLQARLGNGRRFLIVVNAAGDTLVGGLMRQLCPARTWTQCVDIVNCFWNILQRFVPPIVCLDRKSTRLNSSHRCSSYA